MPNAENQTELIERLVELLKKDSGSSRNSADGEIGNDFIDLHRSSLETARDVLTALLEMDDGETPDIGVDLSQLADGRYDGGNHMLAIDARVDFTGSGIISGDLFGTQLGRRDYLTSFRTAPGEAVTKGDPQPWVAIFEARDGSVLTGAIELREGNAPNTISITLEIDGSIEGLPSNRRFELSAEWQSAAMRRLGIEFEQETGTQDPPSFDFNGRSMTYRLAFQDAGFDVFDAGSHSNIPREPDGWGQAQLHALMTDFAQADLSTSAWRQQLLWLRKSTRSGLLGVMFDSTAQLPRQGTAVFEQEIRDVVSVQTERKIIQTTVHEIGHGLNLAHRFEREVGRADSTSFMNYDWKFMGGNRRAEFWERFQFTFDPDELEFLRHAPRKSVIPGGAPFHSVNYWADGNGGYSPYAPEEPLEIVDLRLTPPIGGPIFSFGQQVFLQVTLTNTSGGPLELGRHLLDPKGNFLQVVVRRLPGDGGNNHDIRHFHPIMERCYDIDPGSSEQVPNGQSISDNVNITFGSGGFTFAEPGRYEVQVFGSLFINTTDANPFNDRELIAPSNKLIIHVAHPQSRVEEEEVVSVLLREDVGTYFAFGGSSALEKAEDDLCEVLARRMAGKKEIIDPVAANIVRCQGIDSGRRYRRFRSGRYPARNGDPDKAAALLSQLGKEAMRAFDQSTIDGTSRLLKRHLEASQSNRKKKSR